MSAGLRIFSSAHPTQRGMTGAPIHPMHPHDVSFWRIRRERKEQETRNGRD